MMALESTEVTVTKWEPLKFLKEEQRILLLILNQPLTSEEAFCKLWENAVMKICCDGGTNRLHQFATTNNKDYIPDYICGDGDSIEPEIKEFYMQKGSQFVSLPDQNHTDFTKSTKFGISRCDQDARKYDVIVGYPALGGRLDHTLGNINTLFTLSKKCSTSCYLLSETDVVCLLKPGINKIITDSGLEGEWCGLIPIGQPSIVTTKGLQYDVDNSLFEFGGLVSTSNALQEETREVFVETSAPLLWTLGYNMSK